VETYTYTNDFYFYFYKFSFVRYRYIPDYPRIQRAELSQFYIKLITKEKLKNSWEREPIKFALRTITKLLLLLIISWLVQEKVPTKPKKRYSKGWKADLAEKCLDSASDPVISGTLTLNIRVRLLFSAAGYSPGSCGRLWFCCSHDTSRIFRLCQVYLLIFTYRMYFLPRVVRFLSWLSTAYWL